MVFKNTVLNSVYCHCGVWQQHLNSLSFRNQMSNGRLLICLCCEAFQWLADISASFHNPSLSHLCVPTSLVVLFFVQAFCISVHEEYWWFLSLCGASCIEWVWQVCHCDQNTWSEAVWRREIYLGMPFEGTVSSSQDGAVYGSGRRASCSHHWSAVCTQPRPG